MQKSIINISILLIIQILLPLPGKSEIGPAQINKLYTDASKRAIKSVVSIIIYDNRPGSGKSTARKTGYASGTVITDRGHILTNYHVVSSGNYYQITDNSGRVYQPVPFSDGSLYKADKKTDIALLQVHVDSKNPLVPIELEDSNNLKIGELVIAVGNPYGLKQSITGGIVSSTGRDNIGFADIEDFIQSDVNINPGNSGGPLVNLYGHMVGLNTAIRSKTGTFQGISFSIPSNIVSRVCADLISYGRVRRGWMGFIARDYQASVEIVSVIKNSPAEYAQLRAGDIIIGVNGKEVNSLGALLKYTGTLPIGVRVDLLITRNNRKIKKSLILREKQIYHSLQKKMSYILKKYGFTLSEDSASRNLVVSQVTPISLKFGLKQGDQLIFANSKRIHTLEDFLYFSENSSEPITKLGILRGDNFFEIDILQEP